MNIEEIRDYCLLKKGVTEDFPFNESVLVFKVENKLFALTDINSPKLTINLKCEPSYALELREQYEEITPGFHMNKKHWNTVQYNGQLQNNFIFNLIDHSYDLVFKSLPKKTQARIALC